MDFQTGFNLLVGVGMPFLLLWINNHRQSMNAIHDKVQAIEVLVAGNYVRRDEFEAKMVMFLSKLEQIDQKLDRRLEALR